MYYFRSKYVRSKGKVKQRVTDFINNDIEENIGLTKLENFLAKFYVFVSPTFEDYANGYRPKHRIIISTFIQITHLLIILRFIISGIINKPWIWSVMSDASYLLGNSRVISIMIGMFGIFSFLSIYSKHWMDSHSKLHVIPFLNHIKNKANDNQLNRIYHKKFAIRTKLFTKFWYEPIFYPLIAIAFSVLFGSTIVAYFDPKMNFSLISITFWNLCTLIWLTSSVAMGFGDFVYWYLSTLYLKYQFKQINDKIALGLKNGNNSLVMDAIISHNSVSKSTAKLNSMFKYFILTVYLFAKPPINLLLYLSHSPQTNNYARVVTSLGAIIALSLMYIVNYTSASVSSAAKCPYPLLYSYLVKRRNAVKQKLKILGFIEKISGPEIGFYCFDFFPLNNLEFSLYIADWVSNYFLVAGLI